MVVLMNAIAQASPTPASGPKLDNRRVMAAIVDLVIVSAGALVILVAGDSLSGDRPGALAAVIIGWALYYFFALESGEGQTLGKKLMKIRVVRADGRPAGMGEIAVRTILRVIDNYLIGLIVMLATGERRQRIGDLAAGTIVVDASAPAVVMPPAPALDDAEPVEYEADSYEPDEDEDEDEAEVEEELSAGETITLPARPAPPATLADLTEPEPEDAEDELVVAEVVDEPVAEEPVTEDSVVDESAEELEPVVDEPVAEEPVAEDPVVDESAEELEPVNVKSVETVSAMDLIMGAAEEAADDDASESEEPASA
jgi:uncharacterized RDD family membrane protein YckC